MSRSGGFCLGDSPGCARLANGKTHVRLMGSGSETAMLIDELDREIAFTQVAGRCRDLVGVLRRHGVSEEDRVVLSAGNSANLVVALFALMELGVSVALVDPRMPQSE